MGNPVSKNYMDEGGDRWTIGPEGELRILGTITGGMYAQRYYVDNVNGDDANDGLSPAAAFEQIAAAVTAWEAYRATLANPYERGAIYIKGTSVAYTAVAALPNYCDIIGDGANPNGNGTGIAMIGADGADGIAGTARGLGLYNLQFISGGAFWCADFVQLLRSTIEDCAFQTKDHASDGGIRFTGASGGITMRRCHWLGSGNVIAKVGFKVSGTNFNDVVVEKCHIHGTDAGVQIDNTCSTGSNGTAADNSIFEDNAIGDLGRGCAVAIDDNCLAGMIQYIKNSVMGSALITCVNNGAARVHGNVSANGFVAVTAS